MNSFNAVWEKVCEHCKSTMHEVAYTSWISTLKPLGMSEKKVSLKATSKFQMTIVQQNYISLLKEAFFEIFGFEIEIDITSDDSNDNEVNDKLNKDDDKKNYTFNNFVVGSSNRFAHAGAMAVAKNPGHSYNPFFIYGNSGLGKTHLLNAIYTEIKQNNPEMNLVYTNGESFTNELITALGNGKTADFREKFRNADVLFIDDIHFIAGKEQTQEEFFNTFNALHDENKQIVVTADRPPKEIQLLTDRVRSRFEMGLLADVQQPDFETRIEIIKRKADEIGFEIPDDIMNFIANNIKNNVRQLEGTVNKLHAYSGLTGEKPNMTVTINAISDIKNNNQPAPVTIEKIISEVARYYNIEPSSITSINQTKEIANARHLAIYISRDITGMSLENIGKEFGNRDHSTVHYSVDKIAKEIKKNQTLKLAVDEITKNINDSF